MVFLGDGYTASQITTNYTSDIQKYLSYIFDDSALTQPLGRYEKFFNIWAVDVVSNQSGADDPSAGIVRDTALDATYRFDGVTQRLLYVNETKANAAMNAALSGTGFTGEMRYVLVNDTQYGGGGGFYGVYAAGNNSARDVALHEIGHSFAGLADEYDDNNPNVISTYTGAEPSQVDVTKNSTGAKWAEWLGYNDPVLGVVGAYEGGLYNDRGIYRPTFDSKMRDLDRPFDPIARQAFIHKFYQFVDPLDSYDDNTGTKVNVKTLSVKVIDPAVINVDWTVDGQIFANSGQVFSFANHGLGNGTYTVTARAYDPTDWVRDSRNDLEETVTWHVVEDSAGGTTITLQPGAEGQDLWITNTFTYNDDYGVDNEQLKVGGWGDVYDSLIKFDLSAVHASHVSSATLKLYSLGDSGSTPTGISVENLQRSWDETYGWFSYGGVRGNPTSDPANLTYQHLSTVDAPGVGWITIDITAAVNSWLADPASNNGLLLRPLSTNNNFDFFVSSDATGANAQFHPTLVIQADGTASAGSLSINDVSISEGDSGTKNETFTVTRSGGTAAFDVNFTTADGTGTVADHDYVANAGTLHFDASVNTQTIKVTINGDTKLENSETFFVNLSGATNNAGISDNSALGTIVNDEGTRSPHEFNGDGKNDFLWRNDGGAVATWDMNDRSSSGAVIGNASNDWHIADTGDFNGDGKSDLLWRNDSGAVATWDMNDRSSSGLVIGSASNDWHIAGTGDFNGDQKTDILWRNDSGAVATWDMNDRSSAGAVIGSASNDWHIAGTGDFNGDGMSDILWRNDSGAVATWDMNDRSANGAVIANVSNDWHIAGTGDFNGDGRTDILWRNDSGAVATWDMNDRSSTGAVIANVSNDWHIAETGDFNGDHKTDILWRNDNGAVATWDMDDRSYSGVVIASTPNDWHIV
jgi:hypothetical protein